MPRMCRTTEIYKHEPCILMHSCLPTQYLSFGGALVETWTTAEESSSSASHPSSLCSLTYHASEPIYRQRIFADSNINHTSQCRRAMVTVYSMLTTHLLGI